MRQGAVSLPRRFKRVAGAMYTALATGMGSKKSHELSLNPHEMGILSVCPIQSNCPRNVLRPNNQLVDNSSLHLKFVRNNPSRGFI